MQQATSVAASAPTNAAAMTDEREAGNIDSKDHGDSGIKLTNRSALACLICVVENCEAC